MVTTGLIIQRYVLTFLSETFALCGDDNVVVDMVIILRKSSVSYQVYSRYKQASRVGEQHKRTVRFGDCGPTFVCPLGPLVATSSRGVGEGRIPEVCVTQTATVPLRNGVKSKLLPFPRSVYLWTS